MLKTRIHNVDQAYKALFEDMRFETDNNTVYIPKRTWNRYAIIEPDDYEFAFKTLTDGVISEDNIRLLRMRYGLLDGVSHTLKQCGEAFYLTTEATRLRIRSSFRKMRHRVNLNHMFDKIINTERRPHIVKSNT